MKIRVHLYKPQANKTYFYNNDSKTEQACAHYKMMEINENTDVKG